MISKNDILNAGILIVDDQQANTLLLEQLLRDHGYRHVTTTTDPKSVSALHDANHYDLILLDLLMPGMDGFEVMEALKKKSNDDYLPILVLSIENDLKLAALTAGAKDFLNKPFNLVEATTRIHNMLEVRLLYKQLEVDNLKLKAMAMHDALTGLPNRILLMDRLDSSIAHARRNKQNMAVLFLDLDGFKKINDTFGHDAGDAVLKITADRMVATIRQEDTVARLGGDEFILTLCELSGHEDVEKMMSKLLQVISHRYDIDGHRLNITASIGVGLYPQHGEDGESLIKSADQALREAKRLGKNTYSIATRADIIEMKSRGTSASGR